MLAGLRSFALLGLAGCGRIAFDPQPTGATDAPASIDAPPTDLLLHFAFESDGLLHDRATGHDATCTSCPIFSSGVRAATSAAQFDGISCLRVPAIDLSPAVFTFAVWERHADMRHSTMFGKPRNGATTSANSFEIFSDVGPGSVSVVAGGVILGLGPQPQVGTWHHLAGVFDGSTVTGYVDGTPVNSRSGVSAVYADDAIQIGCDINTGTTNSNFFGSLDEVRLYGRALTASEVAALAAP